MQYENSSATTKRALDDYSIDLTGLARQGKLDRVVGRDAEIRELMDILTRRRQNNPLLVGDAGVGKTAIVEGFALKIACGDVPQQLRGISVRTLDLIALQAGANARGEFEHRLKAVIDEARSSADTVLFIDEAHALFSCPGDAANRLKPPLARGELRVVGATTHEEYKRHFEKDPALARRFQVVRVDEPDEEQALWMVRELVPTLERHYGVLILDEASKAAIRLSQRYLEGKFLPDKAVSLLDTACARVALGQRTIPAPLAELQAHVDRLETELRALQHADGNSDAGQRRVEAMEKLATAENRLADLEDRYLTEKDLVEQVRRLRADGPDNDAQLQEALNRLGQLQGENPLVQESVDERTVASVISSWTGVPAGQMLADELSALLSLESRLRERIAHQDHALKTISERIYTARARLTDSCRPVGVFLLTGPSGSGKTETALALADVFYGGHRNLIRINMSEYQEAHSISGLKGAPPGYVGYAEGGVLTEAVRRRPYSVILLDEVEKAHSDVIELFYDVFDKGRMEDASGRAIDFRNAVILVTSNVGADLIIDLCLRARELPGPAEMLDHIRAKLRSSFPLALLNRLTVIPYYPINAGALRQIIELKLEKLRSRVQEVYRIRLTWSDDLIELLAQLCSDPDQGGRNVDHVLNSMLLPNLGRKLLSRPDTSCSALQLDADAEGALRFLFS